MSIENVTVEVDSHSITLKEPVLSKPPEPPVPEPQESIPFAWFSLLPAFLLIGFLTWYFLKKRPPIKTASTVLVPGKSPALQSAIAEDAIYHFKRSKEEILPCLDKADNLIAEGNLEEALSEIRTFFGPEDDTLYADILSLTSEHSNYQREFSLGLGPDRAILNQITFGLSRILMKVRESLTNGDGTTA